MMVVALVRHGSAWHREPLFSAGTSGHDGHTRVAGHAAFTATTLDVERGWGRVQVPPPTAASPPGSCQQCSSHRGRASPSGQAGAVAVRCEQRHPRRPCHPRAISSGTSGIWRTITVTSKEAVRLGARADLGWGRRPKLHGMQGVNAGAWGADTCWGELLAGSKIGLPELGMMPEEWPGSTSDSASNPKNGTSSSSSFGRHSDVPEL